MTLRRFFEDPAPANPANPANPETTPPAQQSWIDQHVPESLRQDPTILKYREGGIGALAEAHVNLQRMFGKPADSLLELPAERNAETLGPVFSKLGAPKDPDGYQLKALEGAHESLGLDRPLAKGFLEDASKVGLLPHQAQALYDGFAGRLMEAMKSQDESHSVADQEHEAELRKEWGPAWEQNKARINHASDFLGLKDVLNEAGLGMNPAVARALLKVEGFLRETPVNDVKDAPATHSGLLPPNEARERARALQQQSINEKDVFKRRELNAQAAKYYAMANGDAKV